MKICWCKTNEGTDSNQAGIGIRALQGSWKLNSSVKDSIYVILTPDEQEVQTLGSCKSPDQCWRTKLGYDVLTRTFIDFEAPSEKWFTNEILYSDYKKLLLARCVISYNFYAESIGHRSELYRGKLVFFR